MKQILGMIFSFYLFFIIRADLIFAQEFKPEIELFNSELDGYWEIGPVVTGYQKNEALTDYQQVVPSTTTETNLDNLLLHHYLTLQPTLTSKSATLFFSFSFYCETTESLAGFDQPYLLVFYQQELISKEEDLTLCGTWQTRYFLLPDFDPKAQLSLYFGEMGDLAAPTEVTIKELKLLVKPLAAVITTETDVAPIINKVSSMNSKQTADYPINKTLRNWNEKPVTNTGQVLADQTEKLTFKDYLPPYLPVLVGGLVMALSLPLFIWVSDLLVKLFLKKGEKK